MEPKEPIELRRAMAEMHESVLTKISNAYKNKRYIEVCWLCYACFESRVYRLLMKICTGCNKPERTNKKIISITTKLDCIKRLIKNKYEPLIKEDVKLIESVKGWCTRRNKLIHGLLSVDCYNNADNEFRQLATDGITLVDRMYSVSADVREYYYNATEIPSFADAVTEACYCDYKCINL